MNIFVYHPSPELSALWLDDVRKNKMILESCQLLSTAMNVLAPKHKLDCYATSYVNHPCAVWVRESLQNFIWLFQYTKFLVAQRKKPHSCERLFKSFDMFIRRYKDKFPKTEVRTPFVNCARNTSMNADFTMVKNVFSAYRLYHCYRWKRDTIKVSWNDGLKPFWYEE